MTPIALQDLECLVFDFDGVLTDNRVWIDAAGKESVVCNRSDGLAFKCLLSLKVRIVIVSTEENPVVKARAKKLGVKDVVTGVQDKAEMLQSIAKKDGFSLRKTLYVGNDVNDYEAMSLCGHRVCPQDAYPQIKEISTHVLKSCGGQGVVRELADSVLQIDLLKKRVTACS